MITTLHALDHYHLQGRNCYVIDILDNNLPVLRKAINEKLPLGSEVKVLYQGHTKIFKIKGIEMYAAGEQFEHKFISIMDDTVPITKYVEHLAGALEDNIQLCRLCGTVLNDFTNAAWPANQPPPPGFPEGPLYVSGRNPTTFSTMLPAEHFEVKKCTE
jgi:hypothetical protein